MGIEDPIKKLIEAWNRHDSDAMAPIYAADAVVQDPFSGPVHGRENIKKDTDDFLRAFPDARISVPAGFLVGGDTVAAEFVMTGTHTGPLAGPTGAIPSTNRRLELRGAVFFRINAEGLITEERRHADTGSFMRQLGLTPQS